MVYKRSFSICKTIIRLVNMSTEAEKRVLNEFKVSREERDNIALQTVGQFDNELYRSQRANRLTASNFGAVVNRQKETHEKFVKNILSQEPINVPAINYGKENESVAIRLFETKMNMTVQPCGLYIDIDHPYLAATPDGLIGDDTIIEVTCGWKANKNGWNLHDVTQDTDLCLELINGNEIRLKRTHKYYYQIQGQLNILNKNKCYFVYFINENEELHIEEIEKDSKMWTTEMLPELQNFYVSHVLPEIVRRRN